MVELTKPPKCAIVDAGDALDGQGQDEEAPGGISNMRALTASKVRKIFDQTSCFTSLTKRAVERSHDGLGGLTWRVVFLPFDYRSRAWSISHEILS